MPQVNEFSWFFSCLVVFFFILSLLLSFNFFFHLSKISSFGLKKFKFNFFLF